MSRRRALVDFGTLRFCTHLLHHAGFVLASTARHINSVDVRVTVDAGTSPARPIGCDRRHASCRGPRRSRCGCSRFNPCRRRNFGSPLEKQHAGFDGPTRPRHGIRNSGRSDAYVVLTPSIALSSGEGGTRETRRKGERDGRCGRHANAKVTPLPHTAHLEQRSRTATPPREVEASPGRLHFLHFDLSGHCANASTSSTSPSISTGQA